MHRGASPLRHQSGKISNVSPAFAVRRGSSSACIAEAGPALETLEGLDRLAQAPRVEVTGNRSLGVMVGPNALRHVNQLVVRNNGLFRLTGFQNLASAGDVIIAKNPRLIYTSGLHRLHTVDNLTLIGNQRLAPAQISFGSLPTVRGDLTVRGCPGIAPAHLRHDG